jgi:transcriptional regulator with XRE-family HTH domain
MTPQCKKRRLELGLTQGQIADLLGISTSFLGQVERMDTSMHLSLWRNMGRILKMSSKKLYIEIDGEFFARERIHSNKDDDD